MRRVLFIVLLFLSLNSVTHAETQTVRVYGSEGDGHVTTAPFPASWDEQYNSEMGREANSELDYIRIKTGARNTSQGALGIVRGFLSFDLSELPEDAVVETVLLSVRPVSIRDDYNDEYSYVNVFEGFQDSTFTISDNDIVNCGDTLENPNKLSQDVDLTSISQGERLNFELDLGEWFKSGAYSKLCFREGHDVENVETVNFDQTEAWLESWVYFASSEAEGIEDDPYIEITYSLPVVGDREGLYTQIESPHPSIEETAGWADDKFARAVNQVAIDGCETIAKCGCAITSLVMMARDKGVNTAVDGSDVNPGTLNEWLIDNNGYDKFGNVFWERAVDFFGVQSGADILSHFDLLNHKSLSRPAIESALTDSDQFVLGNSYTAGHYFYLTDVIDDTLSLYDPLWYNTQTLDDVDDRANSVRDYNDTVDRGVIYEYKDEPELKRGRIQINLNSPAELLLVDEDGSKTGYDSGEVVEEILNSGYEQNEFIQDQLSDQENTHRTKTLVARDMSGEYELSVIGTDNGVYTLSFSAYDENGAFVFDEIVGTTSEDQVDTFVIDTDEATIVPAEHADVIDRETFVNLTEVAVAEEPSHVQRFFVRYANRIFNAIDRDRDRLALLRLRIFERLLRVKGIDDEPLTAAVDQLRDQLRNN